MNALIRQQVYDKYNGLCAYTGKPLQSDWQVDHIKPKCHYIWRQNDITKQEFGIDYDVDDLQNLLPALRIVNHYKRANDLDGFRKYMLNFHLRLAKLPKKTSVNRIKRRIEYMNEVAELFGITTTKPFCGWFYFETIF